MFPEHNDSLFRSYQTCFIPFPSPKLPTAIRPPFTQAYLRFQQWWLCRIPYDTDAVLSPVLA